MDPDVEFFGIEIPPGATIPLGAGDGDDDDGVALVHATQAALGPSPSPGRHTVFVVRDGVKTPVGTLVEGRCEQFALDLMWSALAGAPPGADVAVCHSGPSPVYVSGYKTVTSLLDGGSDGGEPEFETESESEEDEEAARPRERVKGGKPAKGPAVRDFSDMSDGGSEDSDDLSDGDEGAALLDSDDESDEEEAAAAAALGAAPRTPAKRGREAVPAPDDEDDDDSFDEGSEEDEEEAAAAPPPKKKATPAAPRPAASAGDAGAFEAALAAHLATAGPTKLAALGSVAKRPPAIPKLGKWLAAHPRFRVDGDSVSLRT